MNDQRNVFDDILHREDALTDTLRNYLAYGSVLEALWQTLPENAQTRIRSSPIQDIQTRSSGSHSPGRPDLVISGSDFVLVVEVKIWAKLTDLQRESAYVRWLEGKISNSQVGMVVFLIPDDYAHREELGSCLKKARERTSNSRIEILEPITWQRFARGLELQDVASLNELIREFYNHLSNRFKSVSFSEGEVLLMENKETAIAILKLMDVIFKVRERVKSTGVATSNLNAYDFGYSFYPIDKTAIWFGIWWSFWAEQGLPLCLAVPTNENPQWIVDTFRQQHGDQIFENCLVKGYPLEPDQDSSALIREIITDLDKLLQGENAKM